MTTQDSFSVRARNVSDELFSRYDRLNDLWKQAEERLTQHHVPRPVHHTYASYFPDEEYARHGVQRHDMLGIQKVNGDWRICHSSYDDRGPDDEHWTPITKCSAVIRVQVVKHLPGLEDAVISNGEGFIPIVDEAIRQMTDFLDPKPNDDLRELFAERAKLNGQKD